VLAKALLDGIPIEAPATVHKRADRLHELVGIAESELTDRLREQATATYGVPVELDGGADGLWTLCYRRLELLGTYEHPGFDPLIAQADLPLGVSLGKDRKLAERARLLHARLFGGRGLNFLRGSFRDQSEVAGSILRLIKEDDLVEELAELVGASLVEQLFGLQEQYEAMVVDQLKSTPGGQNLRELWRKIGRTIGQYNNAVLDMLDEDAPQSLELVLKALRPMITLRELIAASRGKDAEAGDEDGEAADLEEAGAEGEKVEGGDVGEVSEEG
jgi:hypothetical protein